MHSIPPPEREKHAYVSAVKALGWTLQWVQFVLINSNRTALWNNSPTAVAMFPLQFDNKWELHAGRSARPFDRRRIHPPHLHHTGGEDTKSTTAPSQGSPEQRFGCWDRFWNVCWDMSNFDLVLLECCVNVVIVKKYYVFTVCTNWISERQSHCCTSTRWKCLLFIYNQQHFSYICF